MTKNTPVTPVETARAINELQRAGRSGIPRNELARLFGSDRRGRLVMAAIAERGLAAVVTVPNPHGEGQVYRLAQSDAELQQELAQLSSRITRLHKRMAGLQRAWEAGGVRKEQEALL